MLRALCFAFVVCLATGAAAQMQESQENVILSVENGIVRWASVYKLRPERMDDPYFHVTAFEHKRGWQPWRYKLLVFHMVVTPKALAASRIDRKAKIYQYKDVEIRGAYHRWLDDPASRADVPICDTDILDCIAKLPASR